MKNIKSISNDLLKMISFERINDDYTWNIICKCIFNI